MKLRSYQVQAINAIVQDIREKRNSLCVLATGCLSGDTMVTCNRGEKSINITLKKLFERTNGSYKKRPDVASKTRSYIGSQFRIGLQEYETVVYSGKKLTYKVLLKNGMEVSSTLDHKFMTKEGMQGLNKIKVGDLIMVDANKRPPKINQGTVSFSPIVSIKKNKIEETYDVVNSGEDNNFSANGIIVSNSGKSVIIASFLKLFKKNSFLIIVNKISLAKQLSSTIASFGLDCSVYSAGMGTKTWGRITVCTMQSLIRVGNPPQFNAIIIDEAHRYNNESFKKLYKRLGNKRLVGFTATPFDSKGYIYGEGKLFGRPSTEKYLKDFTPEFLVPLRQKPQNDISKIDLSNVKMRKGDFIESQLSAALLDNKEKIDEQIEDALAKSANYKKIIVLCVSIEHAEYIYSRVSDAMLVHSKVKYDLKDFNTHRILVSVLIASEGFDYPQADCIWFMRPTRSTVLYIQGAGRILRKARGKDHALMLDYGSITENLGLVYDAHKNIKDKKDTSVKICPHCGDYNPSGAKICQNCGEVFMSICTVCLESKPFGTPCCTARKDIDYYKNLKITNSVFEAMCDSVFVQSKKGNPWPFLIVTYHAGLNKFCSEIVSSSPKAVFFKNKFCRSISIPVVGYDSLKSTIENNFKAQKIKRRKENGYWKRT